MSKGEVQSVTTFPAIIGAVFRHYRERNHMSQKALCDATGLPQSTVSRIEKGEVAAPIETLDQLARAMNVSLSLVLAEAETARGNLQNRGVQVRCGEKPADLLKQGLLVVGIAALVALIFRKG